MGLKYEMDGIHLGNFCLCIPVSTFPFLPEGSYAQKLHAKQHVTWQ